MPRVRHVFGYRVGSAGKAQRHRTMLLMNHARGEHHDRNARHDCAACRRFSPVFVVAAASDKEEPR